MGLRPRSATDDRGEPCTLPALRGDQLWWRSLGLPSLTRDEATRAEQGVTDGLETIVSIVGAMIGVGVYVWVLRAPIKGALGPWGSVAGWVLVPTLASVLLWLGTLGWGSSAAGRAPHRGAPGLRSVRVVRVRPGRPDGGGRRVRGLPGMPGGVAAGPGLAEPRPGGRVSPRRARPSGG